MPRLLQDFVGRVWFDLKVPRDVSWHNNALLTVPFVLHHVVYPENILD